MSTKRLKSTLDHLDTLLTNLNQEFSSKRGQIAYPTIKSNLETAAQNYRIALSTLKTILSVYILDTARLVADASKKRTKTQTVDDVLDRLWGDELNNSYGMGETILSDFTRELDPNIPLELYYLVLELFEDFGFAENFVLRQGGQFVSETFEETVFSKLRPLLESAKPPVVPGTLETVPTVPDFMELWASTAKNVGETVPNLVNTIVYIEGEAHNPLLWPILIHEGFHLMDRRLHFFEEVEEIMFGRTLTLDKSEPKEVNRKWAREIFQDICAVHYFGPLYAYSLLTYFEKLPYIQTIGYPEMSSRLYAVKLYVERGLSNITYTNFLAEGAKFCSPTLAKEIQKYEENNQLDGSVEKELERFYDVVASWLDARGVRLFTKRLRQYVTESSEAVRAPVEGDLDLMPYVDSIFTLDDVVKLLFKDEVALAIDPMILLNIGLMNSAPYTPEGWYKMYVNCIRKYRIKKAWKDVLLKRA